MKKQVSMLDLILQIERLKGNSFNILRIVDPLVIRPVSHCIKIKTRKIQTKSTKNTKQNTLNHQIFTTLKEY